jgi:hypothetical protein
MKKDNLTEIIEIAISVIAVFGIKRLLFPNSPDSDGHIFLGDTCSRCGCSADAVARFKWKCKKRS